VRYDASYPVIPRTPVPSPPFHQTPLPDGSDPEKKLQTVRLSTLTPFACQTTIPLRPAGIPPTEAPNCWSAGLDEHAGAPGFVPSTTTLVRLMPRRWTCEVVMRTPPKSPAVSYGDVVVRSSVSW